MRSASFFWVGSEAPVQGIQPTYWKRYDGSIDNYARVDSVIKWLNYPENKRPQLITLYFSDTDSKGHRFGPESKQLEKAVMHVDSVLGYLLDKVQETNWQDKLNIMLVSDHGMAQTDSTKIILVPGINDNPDIIRAGDGSTMLLWSKDSLLIEQLDDRFDRELEHTFSYTKAEIPDRYHFKRGKRIPDLLLVTEEPYMLAVDDERRFAAGMHGYDPQNLEMHGIFLAEGPAVKKTGLIPRFENVHIYPFAAAILQLQPNPDIDGNPDVLGKYLK